MLLDLRDARLDLAVAAQPGPGEMESIGRARNALRQGIIQCSIHGGQPEIGAKIETPPRSSPCGGYNSDENYHYSNNEDNFNGELVGCVYKQATIK